MFRPGGLADNSLPAASSTAPSRKAFSSPYELNEETRHAICDRSVAFSPDFFSARRWRSSAGEPRKIVGLTFVCHDGNRCIRRPWKRPSDSTFVFSQNEFLREV